MQYRLSDFQKTRFPPIDTPCLLKFERGCTRHDSPVDYRELTKLKEHRRGERLIVGASTASPKVVTTLHE